MAESHQWTGEDHAGSHGAHQAANLLTVGGVVAVDRAEAAAAFGLFQWTVCDAACAVVYKLGTLRTRGVTAVVRAAVVGDHGRYDV